MKRYIATIISFPVLTVPFIVLAQAMDGTSDSNSAAPTSVGAAGAMCSAINWAYTILVALAVLFALLALVQYIRANDANSDRATQANHFIIYVLILVIVAILIKSAPAVLASYFGMTSLSGCH